MVILLDNGHGENTKGKCSPDGAFREYLYAREIADGVMRRLRALDYDARRIVRENLDVSLRERCRRVNEVCKEFGTKSCLLVSIHVNAAGNGKKWMGARGWEAWTTPGRTLADSLATKLYEAAAKYLPGQRLRKDFSDGDPDKEKDFYIVKNTKCAAVLTENLFMDNREDVAFLMSPAGKEAIIDLHVEGIMNFVKG